MSAGKTPVAGAEPREGQTYGGTSRITAYANFVKLPHTVFALPFALVGVVLASYSTQVHWSTLGWVVLAFTSARFAAMGFNRIADREIDAKNPRTQRRELPAGVLRVAEAWVAVVIAACIFMVCSWELNPLCAELAPIALCWVFFYSYTKRFTQWSHLVLGFGLSIAPVGGYLAIRGVWSQPWWMLIALSGAVTTWSGGFDVLYALQDIEFDRHERLHSIPVALGEGRALLVARLLHAATICCLAAVGAALFGASHAGSFYALGVVVVAGLLIYEHSLVRPGDLTRLDAAFFTMNGVISIAFLVFVLIERLTTGPHLLYAARAMTALGATTALR